MDKKQIDRRKRLVKVTPYPAFVLILEYEDGERRIYDCRKLPDAWPALAFLRDYENFQRVYIAEPDFVAWDIDPKVDSRIEWMNQVDLCPDACYENSRHIFAPCEDPKNYETITLELDWDVYREANRRCREYGLTFEEAVSLFLEDLVRKDLSCLGKKTDSKGEIFN